MLHFRHNVVRLIASTLLICSCGSESRDGPVPPEGAMPERRFLPVEWSTVWQRGGTESDTLLLLPIDIAAAAGRVYVADRGGRRVLALSAQDGTVAWTSGREGSGPAEFVNPSALAVLQHGGVAVIDPGNQRITTLDSTGAYVSAHALPGPVIAATACGLGNGNLLVGTASFGEPLLYLAADGKLETTVAFPWEDLREHPSIAMQSFLTPTADGEGCVLAHAFSHGFAEYEEGRFLATHPYVEQLERPTVEIESSGTGVRQRIGTAVGGAIGVATRGDTVVVPFLGNREDRGRFIDLYHRGTGAYLHSLKVPFPVRRITTMDTLYVFLTSFDNYPAIVAVKARVREY